MDAVGVELESETVDEVASIMRRHSRWTPGKAGVHLDPNSPPAATPAADSLWTKLSAIPYFPGALWFDLRRTAGVPSSGTAACAFLQKTTGHAFPVLANLTHGRVIRAIATMLRDNLDPQSSTIGLPAKVLAGVIFCTVAANKALLSDMRSLATHHGIDAAALEVMIRIANVDPSAVSDALSGYDAKLATLLLLARAVSPSPAEVDASVVAECRRANLSPAAIVELCAWISVLQMLHRLSAFYAPMPEH